MEKSVDEENDQGSGWLQVKKKHRSSSRFSLQGWVGGLSGKQNSNLPFNQGASTGKKQNSQGKYSNNSSRVKGDFPIQKQGPTVTVSSISDKVENIHNLDKTSVGHDDQRRELTSMKCDGKIGIIKEIPDKDDNHNPCQKIKWGDLVDEELTQHINNAVGKESRFGEIFNGVIVTGTAELNSSIVSCVSPNVDAIANKTDSEHSLCRSPSFAFSKEPNCKDVNEVLSEDVKVEITNEEVGNFDGSVSNVEETYNKQIENDGLIREVPGPTIIHEVSTSEKAYAPLTASGPEKTGEVMRETYSIKGIHDQQSDETSADLSNTEVRSGNDAGDSAESRERFRQRLWCFLFENLNRAVDELYLLCELECDTEQMSEAMLVLEEAASDFKELKSRVEKFENVKGSTSQVVEVPPVTMKSDHRRPHAVSWEVRRMTTSPHKAEILSSSLEAFMKIQQEQAKVHAAGDTEKMEISFASSDEIAIDDLEKYSGRSCTRVDSKETVMKIRNHSEALDIPRYNFNKERRKFESGKSCKISLTQKGHLRSQNPSASMVNPSKVLLKERSGAASLTHKIKREQMGSSSETERFPKKEKVLTESSIDKYPRSMDYVKKQNPLLETDGDKKLGPSWKTMDAWKEKRNWEDILASPYRGSSRYSHSPGVNRKSAERARNLHVKLMSPEKKKKTALDLKKEAEQKHARATKIRNELENEKIQKLQRSSEKHTRVNEWQAVRSMKLREGMRERHQRSESRHGAYLAQVVKRAGDESNKVNEVRFITSLNDENKKLILRQKHQDSELRRAERQQVMKSKQKEDIAREEAVLEKKKLLEAEKLQRLAETQRKKEEAQVRREEERKASSAVREARAIEHVRRKEIRAKAQQEEAELLAQKLAERLRESEQRRKFYLEQIRERASMDFRDQSSPFLKRSLNKDAQGRSITPTTSGEEFEGDVGASTLQTGNVALQQILKRRIKRIRQKLMALKYEFSENPVEMENGGIGYRTAVGTARSKLGRWLQELQKFRQARKEGAAGIGLITAEMIKFLEGKEPELQAARQAGVLDFIASALPASHTSKPEAYQVTIYLLRLLKVVLSLPANRSYFIAQNLLPPIIPILATTLENYIKIAASSNVSASSNLLENKTSAANLESISEALDGFLWTVTTVIGHVSADERQLQMQDGLLELVLAYQVIHRLRDFFALYDRPQVEGSPFPSSIHLSINLLTILTSRSRDIASIACGSLVIEEGPELVLLNNYVSISLPEVPEDDQGSESYMAGRNKDSVLNDENSNDIKIESTVSTTSNVTEDSRNVLVDDSVKPSVPEKDEKSHVDDNSEQKNDNRSKLKPSVKFLLSAMSETGLVCLPSLLTAVLLQANNRLSSEQVSSILHKICQLVPSMAPHVLPSNFEEVATGVLKVLNNLAFIDISFMQKMLARPDLKMEFFHLMSFLLAYCTSKWRVATDQVGLLLMESLLLLGYFSLFHSANQAVLRWGKSPTILHKVCDLPFVFFSDPNIMPVLAGTLVAACYGCKQNKDVIQQELSTDMLLSLLKSCRNSLPTVLSNSSPENHPPTSSHENNQVGADSRKIQTDKTSRLNIRSNRISCTKSGSLGNGNGSRSGKIRNQRDNKTLKPNDETSLKLYNSAPEASSALMLHSRFSDGFIDRAEQFFATETTDDV